MREIRGREIGGIEREREREERERERAIERERDREKRDIERVRERKEIYRERERLRKTIQIDREYVIVIHSKQTETGTSLWGQILINSKHSNMHQNKGG